MDKNKMIHVSLDDSKTNKNGKGQPNNSILKQCPVCRSDQISFKLNAREQYKLITPKDAVPLKARYNFFTCHNCYAEFLNPPPTQEELFKAFQDLYETQLTEEKPNTKKNVFTEFLKNRRYRIITNQCGFFEKILFYPLVFTTIFQVRLIRKFLKGKQIQLLDIGCGPGKTIEVLKSYFPVDRALGIDFSENSIKVCQNKGIDARQMNIDEIHDQFNLITVVHVLEHMPHPIELIKHIDERLEDNGIVIISLPNVGGWGRKMFGENWIGLSTPKHLVNYQKETLFRLFKYTNLKIIHYSTRGFFLRSHKFFESRKFNFLHRLIDITPSPLFFNFGDEHTVIAIKETV